MKIALILELYEKKIKKKILKSSDCSIIYDRCCLIIKY